MVPSLVKVTVCVALGELRVTLPKFKEVGATAEAGPVPLPDRVTDGVPAFPVVMMIAPPTDPPTVGAKLTLMVQLVLAVNVAGQLFVCVNCELLDATDVMLMSALPVLLTVTGCDVLVVPTACEANVNVVGLTEATAPTPVPASEIVCGLFWALSVMVMVPVRAFAPAGVNVTLIVQLPLTIRLLPQLLVCANSLAAAMEEIASGPAPVLVIVTDCEGDVVPTFWLENVKLVADSVTAGWPTAVPLIDTVCGLPVALSARVSVAVCVPVVVGENVM